MLPIAYGILHIAQPLAIPIEPIPLPIPRNSSRRPASLATSTPIQINSHSVGALACYFVVEAIC